MSSSLPVAPHRKAIIGAPSNFWLHSSQHGFDLTHPSNPSTPSSSPKTTIQTTTTPITIDPSKSALVIIDMQNFFLSPAFGRTQGPGHLACDQLIKHAIPAARKAGIRIIWLNWGLTDEDMKTVPPAIRRAFGFFSISADAEFADGDNAFGEHPASVGVDRFGVERKKGTKEGMYCGLGADCGVLQLDGKDVDAGRLLMRDTWNAALYTPLDSIFAEGSKLLHNPDVWIHKDRMSGMWGAETELQVFLEKERLRTLFFAGVNTDQCVGGTLTDAFSKGYDCVLLSDGCGTSSPEHAQKCWEFNCARTFGFCTSCEEVAIGVEAMEK